MNVFLVELDLAQGLFHLIYNPYPELLSFHNISTFTEMEHMLLDELVIPSQRQQMELFLHRDLKEFMQKGLRRPPGPNGQKSGNLMDFSSCFVDNPAILG